MMKYRKFYCNYPVEISHLVSVQEKFNAVQWAVATFGTQSVDVVWDAFGIPSMFLSSEEDVALFALRWH